MPSIVFSPDTYNNGFGCETDSDDSDVSADNYETSENKSPLPIKLEEQK